MTKKKALKMLKKPDCLAKKKAGQKLDAVEAEEYHMYIYEKSHIDFLFN
jgi:hypothetical protein